MKLLWKDWVDGSVEDNPRVYAAKRKSQLSACGLSMLQQKPARSG